jgi:predicted metal-dependent hydrolase
MARIPQELNGARVIIRRSRNRRKTVSLGLSKDGSVWLHTPHHTPEKFLEDFFLSRIPWIEKKIKNFRSQKDNMALAPVSPAFKKHCRAQALSCVEQKIAQYGKLLGVRPHKIRINSATTRWGSCSAQNNINFPWRIALLPPTVVDYIVVHELAHIKEKNHGPRFWKAISGILPDFKNQRVWLRKNAHLYPSR